MSSSRVYIAIQMKLYKDEFKNDSLTFVRLFSVYNILVEACMLTHKKRLALLYSLINLRSVVLANLTLLKKEWTLPSLVSQLVYSNVLKDWHVWLSSVHGFGEDNDCWASVAFSWDLYSHIPLISTVFLWIIALYLLSKPSWRKQTLKQQATGIVAIYCFLLLFRNEHCLIQHLKSYTIKVTSQGNTVSWFLCKTRISIHV